MRRPAPVIETARFRLRGAEPRDFEAYAAMWADERVTTYIGSGARPRQLSWQRFLGMPGLWDQLGYGYWVFADRARDAYLGCGGFAFWERGVPGLEGFAEAGWAFAPDWWGQGAASEIMAAACAWADAHLDAAETRCIINPGHAASERVAAKLGYRVIGREEMEPDSVNLYARPRGG